ncbi:MAG: transporter substrate-binding domain-containing protein [Xanthobacteraceae bacterium]|nr:transporter substrate-binding domain-containing protein [Xanthobacteraceae bacterium]
MNHHNVLTAALAVLLLIGLAGPRPTAARPLAAIAADGTLRIGMTGDYAPFSLRGADGRISGANVAMAESLAKALGVALVIVPTTWKTLAADLAADRYDVAMGGVSITADRAALGNFSHPVLHDGKRPIARCAEKDRFTSLPAIDRGEVRVVVNPGGTNERFAKANLGHATMIEHADNRSIFDEIAAGHADVMVTDGAEVDYQARRHPGVLCPVPVADSFDHFDKAYWMTRDPALKAAVDTWLDQALAAGDYAHALETASKSEP